MERIAREVGAADSEEPVTMADDEGRRRRRSAKAPEGRRRRRRGGKGKDKDEGAPRRHRSRAQGAPRARRGCRRYYEETVRAELPKQFGLENPHQVPRLEKIVLNVGLGEASKNPKLLDAVGRGAGDDHRPAAGGDQGQEVDRELRPARRACRSACAVTLRGARMYEFLDRFITLAMPRIRDFRGLPNRCFDGRGNYTFGVKEQMIFPEIDYDKVEKIHGMDITS